METQDFMSSALNELPLLPLRDVVVYPHMVTPLFVGRQKSIEALEKAMAADKYVLLVAKKIRRWMIPKLKIFIALVLLHPFCNC